MKKINSLIALLLVIVPLWAQDMILHDPVSGKTFDTQKYSDIKGSPFLFDKWIEGTVTTVKGVYTQLPLKFDVHNNLLFFSKDDMTFEFVDAVTAFVLKPKPSDSSSYLFFKKGIAGGGLKADQFVQVLAEGKISLYRSDIKLLSEINEINKGLVKAFSGATRYFVKKGSSFTLIKLNKQEVMEVLKDKETGIQQFLDAGKLSLKKEGDVAAVFRYYNSL